MKHLRITAEEIGLHPSEKIVKVDTADGPEELVVFRELIRNNAIPVGWPLGQRNDELLVELPRETTRGKWRVWVNRSSLVESSE